MERCVESAHACDELWSSNGSAAGTHLQQNGVNVWEYLILIKINVGLIRARLIDTVLYELLVILYIKKHSNVFVNIWFARMLVLFVPVVGNWTGPMAIC